MSRVPRPVTYGAQRQPTPKFKGERSGGTNRIPSRDGGEPSCTAARVRARRDVVQCPAADTIEPRVQPAESAVAMPKPEIIKQRDKPCRNLYIGGQEGALDGRHRGETDGRCAACAILKKRFAVDVAYDIGCLRGNVGEAAARGAVPI